ncbi:MAG: DUF7691 family protein [Gemmataceae bacterium]
MGYGVLPFAVDWEPYLGLLGCRDEELLAELTAEWADFFVEIDELDELDELSTSTADALRHFLLGEPMDRKIGSKYGYVLEELAWGYGTPLDNFHWCPISSAWVCEQLSPAVRTAGVPADVFSFERHLLFRGPPVPIPPPDDWPAIGYLTPAEAAVAAAAFDRLDPEQFRPIDGHEQVAAVRGWLAQCRDAGHGLVAFYH